LSVSETRRRKKREKWNRRSRHIFSSSFTVFILNKKEERNERNEISGAVIISPPALQFLF